MDDLPMVGNKEGMYAKYRRKRKLLENRFRVFITPPPPPSPPGSAHAGFEPLPEDTRNSDGDHTPTQNHTNTYNGTSPTQSDNDLFRNTRDQSPAENDRPSKDTDDNVIPGNESPPMVRGESQELEDPGGKQTPEAEIDDSPNKVFGEEKERSTSSLTKNDQTVRPDNSADGIDEIINEQTPADNSIANNSEGDLNFDEETRQKTPDNEAQPLNTVNENSQENLDSESQNDNMVMKSISEEEETENVSVTGNPESESARLEENAPNGEELSQLKSDSEIKVETPPRGTPPNMMKDADVESVDGVDK